MMPLTKRGYRFDEVSSAMQKAIRRGETTLAGYWALELVESGYSFYVWKRLYTISAEDCFGIITAEIKALHSGWEIVNKNIPMKKAKGRIFISKAVILLSLAKKSRDADHLQNYVYDTGIDPKTLASDLLENGKEAIPEYALDCHTQRGKNKGKTKKQFFFMDKKIFRDIIN